MSNSKYTSYINDRGELVEKIVTTENYVATRLNEKDDPNTASRVLSKEEWFDKSRKEAPLGVSSGHVEQKAKDENGELILNPFESSSKRDENQ